MWCSHKALDWHPSGWGSGGTSFCCKSTHRSASWLLWVAASRGRTISPKSSNRNQWGLRVYCPFKRFWLGSWAEGLAGDRHGGGGLCSQDHWARQPIALQSVDLHKTLTTTYYLTRPPALPPPQAVMETRLVYFPQFHVCAIHKSHGVGKWPEKCLVHVRLHQKSKHSKRSTECGCRCYQDHRSCGPLLLFTKLPAPVRR